MKVFSITVARTGPALNQPIPLLVTNDLSSFGFFQRQVRGRIGHLNRWIVVFHSFRFPYLRNVT